MDKRNFKDDFFSIPHTYIEKTKTYQDTLEISSKDGRNFRIIFPSNTHNHKHPNEFIQEYYDEKLKFENLFAFTLYQKKSFLEQQYQGWKLYDINEEIIRQDINIDSHNVLKYPLVHEQHTQKRDQCMLQSLIKPNSQLAQTKDSSFQDYTIYQKPNYRTGSNSSGQLDNTLPLFKKIKNLSIKDLGPMCPTYPREFIVPYLLTKEEIEGCSNFRSKNRLPVLSYYYKIDDKRTATLWRCSQGMVHILI